MATFSSSLTSYTNDTELHKPKYLKQDIVEQLIPSPPEGSLNFSTAVENDELAFSTVHKVWSMVELKAIKNSSNQRNLSFDFIIIVDHSESMQNDNKLAYVQATIEYLITKLGPEHRLALLKFNEKVTQLTTGLEELTLENKAKISSRVKNIEPQGNTNISEALFLGLKLLKDRPSTENNRLSFVMLFTGIKPNANVFLDGIANEGLRGTSFMNSLKEYNVPVGCTIHTFGYGSEHDSRTLQKISLNSQGGVYHFIESPENIAPTFGECLAGNTFEDLNLIISGILSTVAYNVNVRIVGCDGCRIVQFYTMYSVKEHQEVKDYSISFGSLSMEETRGLLFKLSLRKLDQPAKDHSLVKIIVSYTDAFTGLDCKQEKVISVKRTPTEILRPIPIALDLHINRFTAAAAIETAIEKANMKQFDIAQKHIDSVIETARNSVSFKTSTTGQYIEDLIADLSLIKASMSSYEVFVEKGTHYSYAFATMYYMERSTGTRNFLGHPSLQLKFGESTSSTKPSTKRSNHYGYVSFFQEQERLEASKGVGSLIGRYADGAILK
jgi:Mg-chelatase subunit ChlD